MAVAAVAGAVGAGRDCGQRSKVDIASRGDVAAATVAAHAGDLNSGLVDVHVVHLISQGNRTVSGRHRNVDRRIDHHGGMNDASIKIAIAAVAGQIAAGLHQGCAAPEMGGACSRSDGRKFCASSVVVSVLGERP